MHLAGGPGGPYRATDKGVMSDPKMSRSTLGSRGGPTYRDEQATGTIQGALVSLLTYWVSYLSRPRRRDERGASLVEYVLLVGMIALVCFVAIAFFGGSLSNSFSSSGSRIAG